ncbi:hypothetical protein DPMN_154962 [Dreissena polymorpha]|uniref:Uncharacterized protein n=1 Tax=Dreissena polymorpha TaxID=45954 RepID=A0A9D4FPI7_DREPO|nr:hypothetical protein DPMN_154962 [Dreissena polymorpha]
MKIGHEILKLGRDFIGTKLLIKFHEDGTRNQLLTDGWTDIRRTKTGHKSSPEQSANLSISRPHLTVPEILDPPLVYTYITANIVKGSTMLYNLYLTSTDKSKGRTA